MPRTAVTLGKTHDGKWELLGNPDAPITEQLQNFRSVLGQKSHPKFALIQFQESDGVARTLRLRTEEAQAAHEKQRAAELEKARESITQQGARAQQAQKKAVEQRSEARKETVSRLSKLAQINQAGAKPARGPQPSPQFRQQQQQQPPAAAAEPKPAS